MRSDVFNYLEKEGLISPFSFEKIKDAESKKLFSLHWEIKTLLYLGILLLTGGLGILVYKNIDSLGHQVVLLFIASVCACCFFYAFKQKLPFSASRVNAPNGFFDYILLLGCLTFITFLAYFQYQYNIFGNLYGLGVFIPMLVLFFCAYYFDHLGILSLAITNLAAWVGITVTPVRILEENEFGSNRIIFTGMLLGIFLISAGIASCRKNFKQHFDFTYTNFGMHILFISVLAAMFQFYATYILWFLFLAGIVYYFYTTAFKERSFYKLLISTLYGYIGVTYIIVNLLSYIETFDMGAVYLGFIYFIASGFGLILFLIRTNKKLKTHDRI